MRYYLRIEKCRIKTTVMKVSIITPTYNRAHLIGDTIQSVLNQSYQDFEHIIVDDGSTDATEEVVKSFNDSRIQYLKHEKLGNLNTLRNIGINQSNGELIAFLDSDDIWVKDKLEIIVAVFNANNQVKFITHDIRYFKKIDELEKSYYSFRNDFFEKAPSKVILFEILPFPNFVFKKEIIATIGLLNESLYEGLQDFLLKVSCHYKLYYLAQSLTYMRIHNSNIHTSSNGNRYFTDYYGSVFSLLLNNRISFFLFLKGYYLNTKNFIKHLLKNERN